MSLQVQGFMERHPDVVLVSLGLALLVCFCLFLVILCMCWKHLKDRRAKMQRFGRADSRPDRIHYKPGSPEERRARYSRLKTNDDGDDDVFSDWRDSTRIFSRCGKASVVGLDVHPPKVAGQILPDRRASMPMMGNQFLSAPGAISDSSKTNTSDSTVNPKTSPELSSSNGVSPPYATPITSTSPIDQAPSPKAAPKNPQSASSSAKNRPQSPSRSISMPASKQLSVDRIKGIVRQNAQRRHLTKVESSPIAAASSATTPSPPADPGAKQQPLSSEKLHSLQIHRRSSPTSALPATARGRSDSPHANNLTGTRNQTILASMNQQHMTKQSQLEPPKRVLKKMGKVSQGELRPRSSRTSRLSMGIGGKNGDLAPSRKISRSLPDLSSPNKEEEDLHDQIQRTVSSATFNYVFSTSESRNTSPTIDEEGITKFGALLFHIRYDRYQQSLIISHMRCSQLPFTRLRGRPDTYLKCRVVPERSVKLKTKIVQDCRDPIYKDDVFQFGPYSQSEVLQCSLLFSVVHVLPLHQKRTVAQCLYRIAETPQLLDATSVFRNLDEPGTVSRRKRGRISQ